MFCLKSYYTLFTNLETNVPPDIPTKHSTMNNKNDPADIKPMEEGKGNSEIAYFFLDLLFLLGNPRRSMTLIDTELEPPCITKSKYPFKVVDHSGNKETKIEKSIVHLDRTS